MKQAHHQNSSEFPTRDIYLATVIKESGIPILRIEGSASRAIFVFKASEEINRLITAYLNGELRADPRSIFDTWKALKSMAFSRTDNVR